MACILSLVLTRVCITLLPRAGFVDLPDARRVHKKPTPRGGGVAIILAFFLASILYIERHSSLQMGGFLTGFALPVLGRGGDLEAVLGRHAIDRLVLAMRDATPEKTAEIRRIAGRTGVELRRFQAEELPAPPGNAPF